RWWSEKPTTIYRCRFAKRSQFLSTSPMTCGNPLDRHLRSRRPTTGSSARRLRPAPPVRARQPLETDQREMSERRHAAAREQPHPAVALSPSRPPLPAESRPPAQPTRDRRKALLEHAPRPRLGAEMVDQNDFAARLGHARKLVERRLGVGH